MEKNTVDVVEIFESINGEGMRAGELALFIRLKGCNLDCSYCDTSWANEESAECSAMAIDDVARAVRDSGINLVTLTGGEPLLQESSLSLIDRLVETTHARIEVETNGSIPVNYLKKHGSRVSVTMDYKLPSSGMESFMALGNMESLTGDDSVKFVIGTREDLEKALRVVMEYGLVDRTNVIFSSSFGMIDNSEIADFIREKRLNGIRLQLQIHKYIWDPERRGV
jgi:7-carboxy-7-deazaguanine synthase